MFQNFCQVKDGFVINLQNLAKLADVNYGLSIIKSKVCQQWNQKYWCFQRNNLSKIVNFGIFIHVLSSNIYFRLLRRNSELKINNVLMNFHVHNNWRSIIDVVENLSSWLNYCKDNWQKFIKGTYAETYFLYNISTVEPTIKSDGE
jgi:hypothetical protein